MKRIGSLITSSWLCAAHVAAQTTYPPEVQEQISFFKDHGFDTGLMEKAVAGLKLKMPAAYKNR